MVNFEPGRSYLIQNQGSSLYANVKAFSTGEAAPVEQLTLRTNEIEQRSQTWLPMMLDNGNMMLVNRHSGLVLNVKAFSTREFARLEQLSPRADRIQRSSQLWTAREDGNGFHTLQNLRSSYYVSIEGRDHRETRRLEQQRLYPAGHQWGPLLRWKFTPKDVHKAITELDPVDRGVNDIGDVNRLTDFSKPLHESTEEVLVGQVVMPCVLVQGDHNPRWRVEHSPWYVLRRFGYWQLVFFYEHSGGSEFIEEQSVTFGLTSGDQKTIDQTTGITVGADAGFGFKGVTAGFSTTISSELRVSRTVFSEENYSQTRVLRRTYPHGTRVSEAIWYRGDHYVLSRMDGSQVLDWRTVNEQHMVTDAHPPLAAGRDDDVAPEDSP